MQRHVVIRSQEVEAITPAAFLDYSNGYARQTLIDHNTPVAVHTGYGINNLAPGGAIQRHVRSIEVGYFILEGEVAFSHQGEVFKLGKDDYGIIPPTTSQSWWNLSDQPARWVEMISPQPRPHQDGKVTDLFFLDAEPTPTNPQPPAFGEPLTRLKGHFDLAQMPPHSRLQMPGFRSPNITGVSIKMLLDRMFGASQFTLFMVEFDVGGEAGDHDHPFEESYFFLQGKAIARLDGEEYQVQAGDLVFSGVGGTHGYTNIGDVPMRWIETQSPQPPTEWGFRFESDWQRLVDKLEGD